MKYKYDEEQHKKDMKQWNDIMGAALHPHPAKGKILSVNKNVVQVAFR